MPHSPTTECPFVGPGSRYLKIGLPTEALDPSEGCRLDAGAAHQILFSLDRSHEVGGTIGDLLASLSADTKTHISNESLRRHFERLWGFFDGVDQFNYPMLQAKLASDQLIGFADAEGIARISLSGGEITVTPIPAAQATLIIKTRRQSVVANADDVLARVYLIDVQGAGSSSSLASAEERRVALTALQAQFATSLEQYQKAWRSITSMELGAPPPFDANVTVTLRLLPETEILDLSAPMLLRRGRELAARRDVATIVAKKADEDLLKPEAFQDLDPEKIQALSTVYLRLKELKWDNEEDIALLKAQAGALGYDIEIIAQAGPPSDAQLSERDPIRRIWHTRYLREDVSVLVRLYDNPSVTSHSFEIHTEIQRMGAKLDPSRPDFDPWVEKETSLRDPNPDVAAKTGGPFTHVFRFELTQSGYVTARGEQLEDVMQRCAESDVYRRKCALLLPVYEETLTRGLVVTKYKIIKRPVPGMIPLAFPRLFVNEMYQYFSEIASPEVGELMSTITLAPGEARKMSLTRSLERESDQRRSATSLLDITSDQRSDLTTETERETRSENTDAQSVEASASGGVNLGIVSFGGSAGGSLQWSSKDFERNLSRHVQKASSSLQRRTKQEVSTSESLRAKSTETETFQADVKNINDGRTLNLPFFSVNQRLRAGLKLRGLSLLATNGVEIVEGSGAFPFRRYPLAQPGLERLVKDWWIMPLPASLEKDATIQPSFRFQLINAGYANILNVLQHDYKPDECEPVYDGKLAAFTLGVRWEDATAPKVRVAAPDDSKHGVTISVINEGDTRPTVSSTNLTNLRFGDMPLATRVVYYPSKAIYLDAQVGAMPGTESYYESMREQEVRLRRASAYKEFADGYLLEAKARWVSGGELGSLPSPIVLLPISIVQILDIDQYTLKQFKIVCSKNVPVGPWRLLYRNELVKEFAGPLADTITVNSGDRLPWLATPEEAIEHLVLINPTNALAIIHSRNDLKQYFPWLFETAFAKLDCNTSPNP